MERGTTVRPLVEVQGRTQFRSSSRLRVAVRRAEWPLSCKGCGSVLLQGGLFARGSEHASALCLDCVEPVEERAAA